MNSIVFIKLKVISLIILFSISGCGGATNDNVTPNLKLDLNSGNYECVSFKTNKGEILIALDKIKAPISVNNFLSYTTTAFYNGTLFHRVIDGFIIQGGGYGENYIKKNTGTPIINEADNGLLNVRGSIAMARSADPQSATTQFFINLDDNNFLNYTSKTPKGWGYAVFGYVISGMNIVENISKVTTGSNGPFSKDAPQTNIVLQTVDVISCNDIKF